MSEPTKPVSELTDSELEQEFLELFEQLDPTGKEAITTVLGVEVGDE